VFVVSIPISSKDAVGNKGEDSWAIAHSGGVAWWKHSLHSPGAGTRGHSLHLPEKNCWEAQCHKKLWGTLYMAEQHIINYFRTNSEFGS